MFKSVLPVFIAAFFCLESFAQPTYSIIDEEKDYKKAKEFIARGDYAFAYPIVKQLKLRYPDHTAVDHNYINDDVRFFYVLCELKLLHQTGREEARVYINSVSNEPRRQIMSFHLAHYYFLENDHENAIKYFDEAGYVNLDNEQIADAKFEKAYSLFNLRRFAEAKPLFDEIHQISAHKYYLPANYYYGFISYYDKDYENALKAFLSVENTDDYKGVVPYYITEIYYFRGDRERALSYGEAALSRNQELYYDKQLRLLLGQIRFERKEYAKALPLLENYVNSTDKVSKEIFYELSYSYYATGNNRKAIEGFKQLSNERDSLGQNSMYLLGDLYLKAGEKGNARSAFQYSANNGSNAVQQQVSRFNYAKLSYELGYNDEALREMRSYLKAYPNSEYDREAKEILTALLTNTSNFSDALVMYESLGTPTPAMQKLYPRILYGRAVEYINDQQADRADALFSKVVASPESGRLSSYAQFWRGEIAYRDRRYNDAIRFLSAFLSAGLPASGEANATAARYNIGYSYFQLENYSKALPFFEQVTKSISAGALPVEQDAYLRSADVYFIQRDYVRASGMYDAVINAGSPQSDYALFQKATIAGIKSSAEKIRLLAQLRKQYPAATFKDDVSMEIALTYIADEKFADALPYLNEVLASGNNNLKPRALQTLGLAYYNNANNSEAIKAYSRLLKEYPQSAEADEGAAVLKDIYAANGRTDEYLELMKNSGRAVSVSEADSLTYSAALSLYTANNCAAAVTALANYGFRYPAGAFVSDANWYRSECLKTNKDWNNAVRGYAALADGSSRYTERSALEAAKIYYFELKDYEAAKKYFALLRTNASTESFRLEALRGLVRSYYQLKNYTDAGSAAKELTAGKGISTDDKSIALLVLGKSEQTAGNCAAAITAYRSLAAINRSAWGAEARYEIAACNFTAGNFSAAEKAALATIKETGSYDEWVTRSYILLGDIFLQQKDYFNAKATYESVAKNASNAELKGIAQQKFDAAVAAEKQSSKISN